MYDGRRWRPAPSVSRAFLHNGLVAVGVLVSVYLSARALGWCVGDAPCRATCRHWSCYQPVLMDVAGVWPTRLWGVPRDGVGGAWAEHWLAVHQVHIAAAAHAQKSVGAFVGDSITKRWVEERGSQTGITQ
jgi:hypothetical protein